MKWYEYSKGGSELEVSETGKFVGVAFPQQAKHRVPRTIVVVDRDNDRSADVVMIVDGIITDKGVLRGWISDCLMQPPQMVTIFLSLKKKGDPDKIFYFLNHGLVIYPDGTDKKMSPEEVKQIQEVVDGMFREGLSTFGIK